MDTENLFFNKLSILQSMLTLGIEAKNGFIYWFFYINNP